MRSLSMLPVLCAASICLAAEADVQRRIIERDQGQAELRLKMQQQQERALNPPKTPSADFERRTIDRDQQQRFRRFQERQAGEEMASPSGVQRDVDRQRAPQTTAEELKRLERERRLSLEPNRTDQ